MTDIDIDLAPFIDHAVPIVTAIPEQIEQACEEADRFHFATVCVYPTYVKHAVNLLHNKKPQVCTVIAFPSGATTSAVKLYEAKEAVDHGAKELDVMINIGWLKAGKINEFQRELAEICEATNVTVKAILELSLLTDAEKKLAVEICLDSGVSYLKTHTGWCGGVTVDDVRQLKQLSQGKIGIKAASGIKTRQQAIELIQAGATRLGTSRGVSLVSVIDPELVTNN